MAIRKRGNSWQVDVTLNGNGTVKPSTPRAGCRRPTLNRVSRSTVGRDVARLQGAARDLIHYAEPAPAVREPSARSLDPICRQPSLCDVGMDRLLQDSLHAEPTDAVFIRFHPFSSVFIRFHPFSSDSLHAEPTDECLFVAGAQIRTADTRERPRSMPGPWPWSYQPRAASRAPRAGHHFLACLPGFLPASGMSPKCMRMGNRVFCSSVIVAQRGFTASRSAFALSA